MSSIDTLGKKHIIMFDDSSLEVSRNYLRNRSDENLKKLVSEPGNKLAYAHYSWSSFASKVPIEEFWSAQLSKISWSAELEYNVKALRTHLLNQKETNLLTPAT